MNGNTIDEFINSLFINCDKEFLCKDKRYMLQGWLNKDGTYTLRMNEISEESPVVFLVTNKDRAYCVQKFEEALLFDGKTIYDAEDDITVEYD